MDKVTSTEIDETKKFSPAEVDEAKKFGEFFIDLLENHRESFIFYLADTAVLDWFGRTIKGPKDIGTYIKNSAGSHKQHFSAARPVQSIGFRESHAIKYPSKTIGFKSAVSSTNGNSEVTPPQLIFSGASQTQITEMGQGDGQQNNYEVPESPMKKCKLDNGQGDNSRVETQMKYLSAEGYLEFRKKSSKKLQGETKWNRPCKLEVAYCANNFEDCTIYMIIYQGNMKCRRNLLKDFESCEPDD